MLYPELGAAQLKEVAEKPSTELERDLYECREEDGARVVAFVSKMFAVPRNRLPRTQVEIDAAKLALKQKGLAESVAGLSLDSQPQPSGDTPAPEKETEKKPEDEDEEVLLGFARLYSGTLTVSTSTVVLLPKYNSALPPSHPRNKPYVYGLPASTSTSNPANTNTPIRITALYEMMGRDLVRVDTVRAGSVFAIEGLSGVVGRSATLCSLPPVVENAGNAEEWVNLAGVHSSVRAFCLQTWMIVDFLFSNCQGRANCKSGAGAERAWCVLCISSLGLSPLRLQQDPN